MDKFSSSFSGIRRYKPPQTVNLEKDFPSLADESVPVNSNSHSMDFKRMSSVDDSGEGIIDEEEELIKKGWVIITGDNNPYRNSSKQWRGKGRRHSVRRGGSHDNGSTGFSSGSLDDLVCVIRRHANEFIDLHGIDYFERTYSCRKLVTRHDEEDALDADEDNDDYCSDEDEYWKRW